MDSFRKVLDMLLRLAGPAIAIYFAVNAEPSKRRLAVAAAASLLLVVILITTWPFLVRCLILRRVRRSHELQQTAIYDPAGLEVSLRRISAQGVKDFIDELRNISKDERMNLVVRSKRDFCS